MVNFEYEHHKAAASKTQPEIGLTTYTTAYHILLVRLASKVVIYHKVLFNSCMLVTEEDRGLSPLSPCLPSSPPLVQPLVNRN